MSNKIECFMLTPTNVARRWLRRYAGEKCPKNNDHYHQAMLPAEDAPIQVSDRQTISVEEFQFADPRWPLKCDCGFEFSNADARQTFFERVYTTPDGKEVGLRSDLPGLAGAPAGAMFFADWFPRKGPDGRCLAVMLPHDHIWTVDGPSSNGNGWTRTGVPPKVTASPSILTPKYHGWLRDGFLVEC